MSDRKATTNATRIGSTWVLGVAALAVMALAVPTKSEAQVQFGVEVGNYPPPAYGYYPAPNGYYPQDDYARQRWIEHEQHERWEAERAAQWRHEQWEREHWREHEWREHERREHHDWDRDRW